MFLLHWEKQYNKEGNKPYGIIQSKVFGAPVVSGNCSGHNPNIIRWAGDPISALDFNSTTVMSSFKQRFNNSAQIYPGLFIKDAVPIHEVENNPLKSSPDDKDAEVITY